VHYIGKLAKVSAESAQESHSGVPANTALSALDAAHERRVGTETIGELLLSESSCYSQFAECPAEDNLIVLGCGGVAWFAHADKAPVTTLHRPRASAKPLTYWKRSQLPTPTRGSSCAIASAVPPGASARPPTACVSGSSPTTRERTSTIIESRLTSSSIQIRRGD
jgi:hypothetical protein